MAIDDNMVYGLTGAQIKELPGRINAVKGMVRELTTADYNANSSDWSDTDPANFDTVALWKLEPGMYTVSDDNSFTVYADRTYDIQGGAASKSLFVISKTATTYKLVFFVNADFNNGFTYRVRNDGYSDGWWRLAAPADYLNSSDTTIALSARQGKVLNEKIQALGNFSTTEVDTGATWIDGSHICKKTVNIGALPNSGAKTVAHGITNLNWIIELDGVAKSSSGDRISLPFPWEGSQGGVVACYADSTNIQITTWMDRSDYSGYVTLYYTKSS